MNRRPRSGIIGALPVNALPPRTITSNIGAQLQAAKVDQAKMADAKDIIFKAAFSGGLYSLGAALMFQEFGSSINIMGYSIPTLPINFGIGASASIASDLLHDKVFALIPKNEKLASAESALVGLGINVGLSQILLFGLGASPANIPVNVMYSAANYGLSEFMWHNIISKKDQGFIL